MKRLLPIIFLLAACCRSFLACHYIFESKANYLLKNQIKAIQEIMTFWGL